MKRLIIVAAAFTTVLVAPAVAQYYPGAVVSAGEFIGADPDANVRLQIMRDATVGQW